MTVFTEASLSCHDRGQVEHMIDDGIPLADVQQHVAALDLRADEREALAIWAQAWHESRPRAGGRRAGRLHGSLA